MTKQQMNKLHFISLGCPKNLVDSEVMLGALVQYGFLLTDDPKEADVICVNTCAFIEDARKEAIDTILEMGQWKKNGRCRLLIVAGCLPQRYGKELAGLLPEVDVFIGAGQIQRVAEIVDEWARKSQLSAGHKPNQEIHVGKSKYLYDHETLRFHATAAHTAYLKIAEGCFHPCSFCVVPKLRGAFRSRKDDSVIEEAREMIRAGVKEINIIAQDTTAYGRDTDSDIASLLEKVASLKGKKWIRILYAYPHGFPERLIDVIRDNKDICRYLDIPIQHISERILKSMRRKGGAYEIRSLIESLRKKIPEIMLRTSLIVGYPGETKSEFDELVDFVCEARFDHLGVFVWSPEEGTAAARLKNRVPRAIAESRRNEIMDVQREISIGNLRRFLNKRIEVLVEGRSKESEHLFVARYEGQAPEIDGVVYINEGRTLPGEFAIAQITGTLEYDLVGKIIR